MLFQEVVTLVLAEDLLPFHQGMSKKILSPREEHALSPIVKVGLNFYHFHGKVVHVPGFRGQDVGVAEKDISMPNSV